MSERERACAGFCCAALAGCWFVFFGYGFRTFFLCLRTFCALLFTLRYSVCLLLLCFCFVLVFFVVYRLLVSICLDKKPCDKNQCSNRPHRLRYPVFVRLCFDFHCFLCCHRKNL